ncbi:hypothetical protein [Candidatus Tisiphia endosymbiont of Nedyus quadrimaculatus]|uniref:hypothetical protein n=1 Tax=Candidatus Tisiphia endosymbiont of Nedyus quadrimaculatus TaxID=3139332 RepID=UPI00345E3714
MLVNYWILFLYSIIKFFSEGYNSWQFMSSQRKLVSKKNNQEGCYTFLDPCLRRGDIRRLGDAVAENYDIFSASFHHF